MYIDLNRLVNILLYYFINMKVKLFYSAVPHHFSSFMPSEQIYYNDNIESLI